MSTEHDLLIIEDEHRMNFLKGEDNVCFQAPQEEDTDFVRSLDTQPNQTYFNYPNHACINGSEFESSGSTVECFGDFLTSAADLCGTDNQRSLRIVLQSLSLSLESVRKQIRSLKRKIRAGKSNPVSESSYWKQICGKMRGKSDRKFQYRLSLNPCFSGDEEGLRVENVLDGQVSKSAYSFNLGFMYMKMNEKMCPKRLENLDKNTNSYEEIAETSTKIETKREVQRQLCKDSTLKNSPPTVLEQSQETQPPPTCSTYLEFADNMVYTSQECMLESQMLGIETFSKLRGTTHFKNMKADTRIKECPPEKVDKPIVQAHHRQMADASEPLLAADDGTPATQSHYEQSAIKTCAEIPRSFQETVREFQELNLTQYETVQDCMDGLDRNQVKSNLETPLCFKKFKRCRSAKQTKDVLQGSRTSIKKLFISRSVSLDRGTAKNVALDVKQITTQSTHLVCLQLNNIRDHVKCPKHFGQSLKCKNEYSEFKDVDKNMCVTQAMPNNDVSERATRSTNILHPEEPKMNEIMQCSKYFEQIKELVNEHLSSSNPIHKSIIPGGCYTSFYNDKCAMVNQCDVEDKAMHWEMCPRKLSQEARRFVDKCLKHDNETAVAKATLHKIILSPIKAKGWSPTVIQCQRYETFFRGHEFAKGDLEQQCLLPVENKKEKPKNKSNLRLPSKIILSFLRFGLELHRKRMWKILDDNNMENDPGKTLLDLVVCIQACVDLCEKFFIDLTNLPKGLHEEITESSLRSSLTKNSLRNFKLFESIDKDRPSKIHNAFVEKAKDSSEIEDLKSERSCEDFYEYSTPKIASKNDIGSPLPNDEHSEIDIVSLSQACDSHTIIYGNVSSNRPADNESGADSNYSMRPSSTPDYRPSYIDEINTEPHGKFHHKQNNSSFSSAFKKQTNPSGHSGLDFRRLNRKVSTYRIRKQKIVPASPPGEKVVEIEKGPLLSISPAPMFIPVDSEIDYESDDDDYYGSPEVESQSIENNYHVDLVQISPPRLSHEPCVCRGVCKCGASIIRRASRYLETKIQPYLQSPDQAPTRSSDIAIQRVASVPKQRSLFYLKETPKLRSRYESADFLKDNSEPPKINLTSDEERKAQKARLDQLFSSIKPSMSSSKKRTTGFKRKSMLSSSNEMSSEFRLRSSTSLSNQNFADGKRKSLIKTSFHKPPTFQWKQWNPPATQRFNDNLIPRTSSYMSSNPPSDFQIRSSIPTSSQFPLRSSSPQLSPMSYENRLMPSVSSSSENRLKPSFSSPSQSRLKPLGPAESQSRLKPSFSLSSQNRVGSFFSPPSERMQETRSERSGTCSFASKPQLALHK